MLEDELEVEIEQADLFKEKVSLAMIEVNDVISRIGVISGGPSPCQ